jgi:hypothetical protein
MCLDTELHTLHMDTLRYGAASPDVRTLLEDDFEFTGNPGDWVATEDLITYVRKTVPMSDHAISRLLSAAGLPIKIRRIGANVIRVRTGLRPKSRRA